MIQRTTNYPATRQEIRSDAELTVDANLTSRREFVHYAARVGATALVLPSLLAGAERTAPERKLKLALSPGTIGVKAGLRECIPLARKYGFDAVAANTGALAALSEAELGQLRAELKTNGLVFGAANLLVEFRDDEAKFRATLEVLPRQAAVLQQAGVNRVSTWISPCHNDLTYMENFRQHSRRLREVAKVLGDHGQQFGIEYVGTPSVRRARRYPFIHSMREMGELIADMGATNVGYVLDSWHWWTAGETERDVLSRKAGEVVSVHLNDAPMDVPLEQQQDNKRELPCATGVIPMGAFLNALHRIGYDGPALAEPFSKQVNDLDDDAACAVVMAALRKAMALTT